MTDIFDFAMKMESDAADFYRDLAARCGDEGLATILSRLADAEIEHAKLLANMKATTPPEVAQVDFLSDVKSIFAGMKEASADYDFDLSTVDLYRQAQEHEKKSEELYRQKATEVENDAQRALLERIADEEQQHYAALQGIIDFINAPDTWLEDAEWHNIEA